MTDTSREAIDSALSGLSLMLDQYADSNAYEGYPKALQDGIKAITDLRATPPPSPLSAAVAYERAAECCTNELRNVTLLMSNPPQSSAAWGARNAIRALSAEIPAADLDAAAVEQLLDADDAGRICLSVATYHALQDLKGSQP